MTVLVEEADVEPELQRLVSQGGVGRVLSHQRYATVGVVLEERPLVVTGFDGVDEVLEERVEDGVRRGDELRNAGRLGGTDDCDARRRLVRGAVKEERVHPQRAADRIRTEEAVGATRCHIHPLRGIRAEAEVEQRCKIAKGTRRGQRAARGKVDIEHAVRRQRVRRHARLGHERERHPERSSCDAVCHERPNARQCAAARGLQCRGEA